LKKIVNYRGVRRPIRGGYIELVVVNTVLTPLKQLRGNADFSGPTNAATRGILVLFTGLPSRNCDILATVSEHNMVNRLQGLEVSGEFQLSHISRFEAPRWAEGGSRVG
jgi:hypothetical protein